MRALYRVVVSGQDISETINPILESLSVTDRAGTTSDTAQVMLDDSDGRLIMPQIGAPMQVSLGWDTSGIAPVFDGTVDEIHSSGGRGSGRVLSIRAKGFDARGKAKEPLEFHKDNATLQEFLNDAAQRAGLSGARVAGALASIQQDYWAAATESLIHLGHRLSREFGGTFKIVGDVAIMAERNSGLSIGGAALATVRAAWGDNLINWDISPVLARPRFEQARVRWYDRKEAKWKEEQVGIEIPSGAGPATHTGRVPRSTSDKARHNAGSHRKSSQREAGSGSVEIMGEPAAQPEGICLVAGTRPGIDGIYRIDGVDHRLSRGSGFTTRLALKQPAGEAGLDIR